MRAPNVLTISPAVSFLDTFVTALMDGTVVPGLEAGLALADTTIYVPTRRAADALATAFLAQTGSSATILPRILPLGAIDAAEAALLVDGADPIGRGQPIPPAASQIWRRLQLAALIRRWGHAIDGALRRVDATGHAIVDKGESFRVATSGVDAFELAGDLAGLIDEMRIEGVAWRQLDDLRLAGFDDYWRITTTFLSIAIDAWPKLLADKGLIDPAERQIALVDAQTRELDIRTDRPTIAIGSTGTNSATARLLAAVARAPRGAVILPGLDLDLDTPSWSLVRGESVAGQEPSFGHPQATMARLLPVLGVTRAEVRVLGAAEPPRALRARIVAEALRPADTTDLWRRFRHNHSQRSLSAALSEVRLIEAADEREEALCVAVVMREALEAPHRTAALVTPDRDLARRVRGELLRWNIEVDDSGGEPIGTRPLGSLARLIMAAASRFTATDLMALLAHPLFTLGQPREAVADLAMKIEIGVLRAVPLHKMDASQVFSAARTAAEDTHAHPAQKALTRDDWAAMKTLWIAAIDALEPLRTISGEHPLALWADAHRRVVDAIAGEGAEDDEKVLGELFIEIAAEDAPLRCTAEDYERLFGRLTQEIVLRTTDRPHPHLQILGLLEARLLRFDVMILGGLDETVWPPQARTDPFLNRPMRHELGLTPPERRIGQTAHDFEQAMGNEKIVLTRALKRGGSPCVPSRFLLRLEALCEGAWNACRDRGNDTLRLARALDHTLTGPVSIKRPRPTPPVDLRPRGLSVTQIETLRRDPYAIYASRILRLAPLPAVDDDIDPAEFGSAVHDALHRFAKDRAATSDPATRRAALLKILRETFAASITDPLFEIFRWPLIVKAAEVFLTFDSRQRETTRDILTEIDGALILTLADRSPFKLRARADRIDFHTDGSATLIDYKTGQLPGNREVEIGLAPQLTLEAAILGAGGFGMPHSGSTRAIYLKLGGKDGGREREIAFEAKPFIAVAQDHLDGLCRLLSSFRQIETCYPSRPFPKYARHHGDFDHLARVREWALASEDDELPP